MYMAPDPHQNGNVPNGYPLVSPHTEQFPPATPSQHYAPTVPAFGPPGQTYLNSPAQYPNHAQMRRKQVRATQACNTCRARKQKCDENRPCQYCKENQYECLYKDVPPPKQDRTMLALTESMHSMQDMLKGFIEGFNHWKDSVEGRLKSMDSRLPPNSASSDSTYNQVSPTMITEHDQRVRNSIAESDVTASRISTPIQGTMVPHRMGNIKSEPPSFYHHPSPPVKAEGIHHSAPTPTTPADMGSERSVPAHPAGAEVPKDPRVGLLGDHTTPAHQLLEDWNSMKAFYDENTFRGLPNVSQYPLYLEQKRGLLRVWGVGEGGDDNDGAQGPASPESSSDAPSPAREGLWGRGYATPPSDAPSPATSNPESYYHDHPGGFNPDGSLKLDADTVRRLMHSYLEHIHILHPFLDRGRLQKNIAKFIELYSPESRPDFSPGSALPSHVRGMKRKRSASVYEGHAMGDPGNPRCIERSVGNAIILLVLALGKCCEWKQPLPGPTGDFVNPFVHPPNSAGSPHSSNGRTPSDNSDSPKKNIDILPGLAYFAHAQEILGNQNGGNTIAHTQAFLLAGLYYGQYARVLESWSLINIACRACSILIRNDLDKVSKTAAIRKAQERNLNPTKEELNEMYRLNLLKCVYWTCLQLESDILAEMSTLTPSGISKFQDEVAYPSGVSDEMPSVENLPEDITTSMLYYSAQIHLRVLLNNAHNSLYRQKLDTKDLRQVNAAALFLNDNLTKWRTMLPPQLQWEETDPPATDINAARLRAKYYGGQYVILRPFLYLAVHEIELPPNAPISALSSQHSSPAAMADVNLVNLDNDQMQVLDIAQKCLSSAIQSTIAFDRVGATGGLYRPFEDTAPQRLIVTNIFGTLHAQFGNMLVLAAVYLSPRMRARLKLSQGTIDKLLDRTIKVLEAVSPNSPVLQTDVYLLRKVKKIIHQPRMRGQDTHENHFNR